MTVAWEPGRIPRAGLVLGVDVGGTKTAALLVDPEDVVVARATVATDHADVSGSIVELARSALADVRVSPAELDAVGIGLPGSVDPVAGTVAHAVNVAGLDQGPDQPIARDVSAALGVPCFIEHDARAAARWLADLDAGGHRSLAYVSIGTGISAGVVLDGRPVAGAAGIAGEIGHVVADPAGPDCVCGLRGCLEAVASGPAIARAARRAVAATTAETSLSPDPTTADVFRDAAAGDLVAREVIAEAAAHLARAIRGLALSFGLELVVVGGGVSRAGDALMSPLLAAIGAERDASPLVLAALGDTVVRPEPAPSDAGAWGAVTVARAGLRERSEPVDPDREEVERRDVTTQSR